MSWLGQIESDSGTDATHPIEELKVRGQWLTRVLVEFLTNYVPFPTQRLARSAGDEASAPKAIEKRHVGGIVVLEEQQICKRDDEGAAQLQ